MATERWSTFEEYGNNFNLCRYYKIGTVERKDSDIDISIEPSYGDIGTTLDFYDNGDNASMSFYPEQLVDLKEIIKLWEKEINKTSIL